MARKNRHPRPEDPDTAGRRPEPTAPRPARPRPGSSLPSLPPAWIRFPVSLLLIWHVIGLFVAPMAVSIDMNTGRAVIPGGGALPPELRELPASAPAGSPPLADGAFSSASPPSGDEEAPGTPAYPQPSVLWLATNVYMPYLDALYLNHGYHFFAPDPAPAHIFEYAVEPQQGELVKGRFPDVKAHWPRLRYHRHFMLAEQVETITPVLPDSVEPIGAARAYAKHLLQLHDGKRTYLNYVQHRLLTPSQVLAGISPDAEWTFESEGDLYEPDNGAASRDGGPAEPIAIPGETPPVRQP